MKKPLMTVAGVAAVALFSYKMCSTGNLKLPGFISTYLSSSSAPMKRDLPTKSHGGQDDLAAGADTSSSVAAQPSSAALSADGVSTPAFVEQDVNSRIAHAVETSRAMETGIGASAVVTAKPGGIGYAGTWGGSFVGPDSGSLSLEIGQDGSVTGSGASTITGVGFPVSGKVQPNGQVTLTRPAGSAGLQGATFTGAINKDGKGSGAWNMANYDLSGTWNVTFKQ